MSRPAVFFDRDNTLIANSDYLGDPDQVELLSGAANAVARVRALGFATVVVSNQSGVARGMFTEDDVRAVNARMDKALLELHPDALIEHHEFCPHHPEAEVEAYRADHARRKPNPGMLLDAADSLNLDLAHSWLIGDAPRDVEAGFRAGCRTILVREPRATESPAANEPMRVEPDYIASSLEDAVDFIEMQLETAAARAVDAAVTVPSRPAPAEPLIAVDTVAQTGEEAATEDLADPPHEDAPPESMNGVAPVSSRLGVMNAAITSSAPPAGADRQTVLLLERVVEELRRANDPPQDFSVARMLAGIVQGFAIAAMFGALLFRADAVMFQTLILLGIFLQAMVSSLVLMGR